MKASCRLVESEDCGVVSAILNGEEYNPFMAMEVISGLIIREAEDDFYENQMRLGMLLYEKFSSRYSRDNVNEIAKGIPEVLSEKRVIGLEEDLKDGKTFPPKVVYDYFDLLDSEYKRNAEILEDIDNGRV